MHINTDDSLQAARRLQRNPDALRDLGRICLIFLLAVSISFAIAALDSAPAWAASPNKADISTATTKLKIVQDSLDNKWDYDGSHGTTRYRWLGKKDSGNLVYCISPGVAHGPFEGESKEIPARLLKPSDFKSKALYNACMAALYYAPGGPGYESDEGSTGGLIGRSLFPDEDYKGGSFGKKDRFGCAHTLMGFYYNDVSWGKTYPRDNFQPAASFTKWFMKEMVPARWGGTGSSSYGQRALDHYNDQDMLANGGYTIEAWEDSVYLLMTGSNETLQDLLTFVDAPRGPIKLQKSSSDPGITDGNPCYSLKGAEYQVYSDASLKHKVAVLVTGADGKAELESIVAGTYYVKETHPSPGFRPDPTVHTVKVVKGTGGSFTSKEEPITDTLEMLVEKDGLGESDGIPQGEASLENAEFEIRFFNGQFGEDNLPEEATRTWIVKTNAQGKVPADELGALKVSGPDFFTHNGKVVFPLGTVTVLETKAPKGYQLLDSSGNAPKRHVLNITEDSSKHAVANRYAAPRQEDAPIMVGLRLWKIDDLFGSAQAQGDATLEGAAFSIVNESANSVNVGGTFFAPGEECLVLETKNTGDGCIAEAFEALPYGNYSIHEKEPPVGYLKNETWSETIRISDETEQGHVFDFAGNTCADMVIRGGIRVPKIDRELQEAIPLAAATLEGAEFTLKLESNQPVIVNGAIFRPGEDVMTIATDAQGVAATGDMDLPYGTYTVRETKAPHGYVLNDSWKQTVEIREDGKTYETKPAEDQVIRGDIRFNKVHEDTMGRLGHVAFLVTSKTTGEQHVMVTDENGNLDSSALWVKHTQSTNANDKFVLSPAAPDGEGNGSTDELSESNDPSNSETGTYAQSNSGESGEKDDASSSDDENGPENVPANTNTENGSSASDNNQNDGDDLNASSTSSDTGENSADSGNPDGGISLAESALGGDGTDSVSENEAIENDPTNAKITTADIKNLMAKISQALGADSAITPEAETLANRIADAGVHEDVSFPITLTFGDELREETMIVALQEDGTLVVRDAETDDEICALEQTENAPADDPAPSPDNGPDGGESSSTSQSSSSAPDPSATDDGSATGSEPSGDINPGEGTSDASDDQGEQNAEGDTSESGDGSSRGATESTSMNETEDPGEQADQGASSDNAAETSVIDSSKLDPAAGVWFNGRTDRTTTPDDTLGALPFDTYTFEELRSDSNAGLNLARFEMTVSRHEYNIDAGTVDDKPMSICTELKSESGTHMAPAAESVKLIDAVTCQNIDPGKSYELRGTLIDKETGNPVGAESKTSFQAEKAMQTEDVVFEVNTSTLAGHSIVAYQELYEEGTLVAEQKDLDDADETVFIPDIATALSDGAGSKAIILGDNVELSDRVDYTNLEPHHSYTLLAELHVKSADGQDMGIAKDANGKEICSSATFEPGAQNGSTTVEFSFDGHALESCELVAFETLFYSDTALAKHEDITDESQTVTATAPNEEEAPPANEPNPAKDNPAAPVANNGAGTKGGSFDKTGDVLSRYWWILALVGLGALGAWMVAASTKRPSYTPWDTQRDRQDQAISPANDTPPLKPWT